MLSFVLTEVPYVSGGAEETADPDVVLHFDEAGHVTAHLDYWDPTPDVWQRIPVLGTIVGVFVNFYALVAAWYLYAHGVDAVDAAETTTERPTGQPVA